MRFRTERLPYSPMTAFDLPAYLEHRRRTIETALDAEIPPGEEPPQVLHKAMRYCVFSGGKRIRPILSLAAAEAAGAPPESALLPAVAVEILHTYTLIHDDLPCMDDDDLRRGSPTCHAMFGEANAVLAGDALQALAFEVLAKATAPPPYPPNALVRELSRAIGSRGVAGGQFEDIAARGKTLSEDSIGFIHLHKTADLFRATVRMGAIAGGADATVLASLSDYGVKVGLAFQITDDLLDAAPLSAPRGAKSEEPSCVAVYGVAEARRRAEALAREADGALAGIPGARSEPLLAIARYVTERTS